MPADSSRRPQGSGGLRRRGDRWQSSAVNPRTGKTVWKTWPAGLSPKQLERAHGAWVAEIGTGRAGDRSLTLGAYLRRWLAQRAADMEPPTHARHGYNVAILRRHADAMRLADLDPLAVTEILADATRADGKPLAPASRRSLRGTLSLALGDAVTWRLLPLNPVSAARLPRSTPTERAVPSTEQVREMIRTEPDPMWRTAWQILWGTGCRPGEMLCLHWGDVDLSGRSVHVRRTMTEGGQVIGHNTKTRRHRRVGLGPDTVDALRAWRSELAGVGLDMVRADRPLFPSTASRSGIVSHMTMAAHFAQAVERVGADPAVTPHAVRHAVASELMRHVPAQLIADQLGMGVGLVMKLYGRHAPADAAMAIMGLLSRVPEPSAADA